VPLQHHELLTKNQVFQDEFMPRSEARSQPAKKLSHPHHRENEASTQHEKSQAFQADRIYGMHTQVKSRDLSLVISERLFCPSRLNSCWFDFGIIGSSMMALFWIWSCFGSRYFWRLIRTVFVVEGTDGLGDTTP